MKKTLVFIRHAHRDTGDRSRDNGLSEKGREQARWLKNFFVERFDGESSIWLASSPKKRCVETLTPIATYGGFEIDINPDLAEQADGESLAKFEARIGHFLQEWERMPQAVTLVSSHGDWLPLAAERILGCACGFKKGSWLEVNWDGQAELRCLIPSFKPFYG